MLADGTPQRSRGRRHAAEQLKGGLFCAVGERAPRLACEPRRRMPAGVRRAVTRSRATRPPGLHPRHLQGAHARRRATAMAHPHRARRQLWRQR